MSVSPRTAAVWMDCSLDLCAYLNNFRYIEVDGFLLHDKIKLSS